MPRMCWDPVCTTDDDETSSLVGGSNSVSRCVGPWVKFTLEYPFKY